MMKEDTESYVYLARKKNIPLRVFFDRTLSRAFETEYAEHYGLPSTPTTQSTMDSTASRVKQIQLDAFRGALFGIGGPGWLLPEHPHMQVKLVPWCIRPKLAFIAPT